MHSRTWPIHHAIRISAPWLTHEEIARGGQLEFEMGILPIKAWGTKP